MKGTENSHKKEMTEREKSTGGRQSKRKNNRDTEMQVARAGQAGSQISESDGERDGWSTPGRNQVNSDRKTLIFHMSKKLEAFILPVHDSQDLSQVMGLQGAYLAGSVQPSDLMYRDVECPVCPLPIHPYLLPAGFHRGVVEGGVRRVSGAAGAEERSVEMQRGISSERCSAPIGYHPLCTAYWPPCLQNYSEIISIA